MTERRKLGPSPLTLSATAQWNNSLKEFDDKLCLVNKKIDKFNIIVPILNKQKVHVNFQKELSRTLENYGYGTPEEDESNCCKELKNRHNGITGTWSFIQKLLEKCKERILNGSAENRAEVAKKIPVIDISKK